MEKESPMHENQTIENTESVTLTDHANERSGERPQPLTFKTMILLTVGPSFVQTLAALLRPW